MNRKKATTWPTYLLRDIPAPLLAAILEEATLRNDNVQDTVRRILCDRYRLDCPRIHTRHRKERGSSPTILLRLQPKLKKALDREAARTGVAVRLVILDALDAHFAKEEVPSAN